MSRLIPAVELGPPFQKNDKKRFPLGLKPPYLFNQSKKICYKKIFKEVHFVNNELLAE